MDPDIRTRAAIEEHWQASEHGDSETEHAIYAPDALLDYPQSGERFRGRATISAQRGGHPALRTTLRFSMCELEHISNVRRVTIDSNVSPSK